MAVVDFFTRYENTVPVVTAEFAESKSSITAIADEDGDVPVSQRRTAVVTEGEFCSGNVDPEIHDRFVLRVDCTQDGDADENCESDDDCRKEDDTDDL